MKVINLLCILFVLYYFASSVSSDENETSTSPSSTSKRPGRRRGRRRSTTSTTTTTTVEPDFVDLSSAKIADEEFVSRRVARNKKIRKNGVGEDANVDCSEDRRLAMSKLMTSALLIGDNEINPPQSVPQLLKTCTEIRDSVNECMSYVRDCYTGMARQIGLVLLGTGKNVLRNFCRDKSNYKDLMDHLNCFRSPKAKLVHNCMVSQALKLHWISRTKDLNADYLIPGMCCTVPDMSACSRASAAVACEGSVKDAAETSDFFGDMVENITGDAIDIFCGQFSNNQTCASVLPKAAAAFAAIDRDVAVGNYTRLATGNSIVIPILDIFERDDFDSD